ncbi:MAG: L-threonylcarbamoyladenylate synthase [Pseudomonadota bacterium]
MAKIIRADDEIAVKTACNVLERGGLAALPTETVYGLAADAWNGEAVARIYEAKGRPSFNPLIAHMSELQMAVEYGEFPADARLLAERFWPGALTIVVPLREGHRLSPLLLAGLPTVAIRVPSGFAQAVIAGLGRPLAAPSANLSGRVSATTADHVSEQLGDRIDLIVDGGPTDIGLESTIVSFVGDKPVLLRPGGIPIETLEEALQTKIIAAKNNGEISAPGMMASHYAPGGTVRLNALESQGEDAVLNFAGSTLSAPLMLTLSASGDLREAAANLFACLSECDRQGVRSIAVAPIPHEGLGLAINDRLQRAAAPRG